MTLGWWTAAFYLMHEFLRKLRNQDSFVVYQRIYSIICKQQRRVFQRPLPTCEILGQSLQTAFQVLFGYLGYCNNGAQKLSQLKIIGFC